MTTYDLTREDWDSIVEICQFPGKPDVVAKIPTKVHMHLCIYVFNELEVKVLELYVTTHTVYGILCTHNCLTACIHTYSIFGFTNVLRICSTTLQ